MEIISALTRSTAFFGAGFIGLPAEMLLVVLTGALIAAIGGRILWRKAKRADRTKIAAVTGRRVPGRIVAVKPQSGFDRERSRFDIRVKLQYFNPSAGREETVFYVLDRKTENLPPQLAGPGGGIVDVGALRDRHKEMQDYKAALQAQGYSKQHIKDALTERAVQQATEAPNELDQDGYLILKSPVEAGVFINNDGPAGSHAVYIVF
jgi:hypothetical protein